MINTCVFWLDSCIISGTGKGKLPDFGLLLVVL